MNLLWWVASLLGYGPGTPPPPTVAAYLDDFIRVPPVGRFLHVETAGRFVRVPSVGRFIKVIR